MERFCKGYKPLTVHFEGIRTDRKAEFKGLFNTLVCGVYCTYDVSKALEYNGDYIHFKVFQSLNLFLICVATR